METVRWQADCLGNLLGSRHPNRITGGCQVAKTIKKKNSRQQAELAVIRPFRFKDRLTGNTIRISVSPYYSILEINRRAYYFRKKNGEFDGVSHPVGFMRAR